LPDVRLQINKELVVSKTRGEVVKNMRTATVFLRDRVKEKLNRGQPTRTLKSGHIIGLDPSLPGEPPKKITGQLQRSISTAVVLRAGEVVGQVGSSLKKAAALEFGNSKGTLKPRPYLRPALAENGVVITKIIAQGINGLR